MTTYTTFTTTCPYGCSEEPISWLCHLCGQKKVIDVEGNVECRHCRIRYSLLDSCFNCTKCCGNCREKKQPNLERIVKSLDASDEFKVLLKRSLIKKIMDKEPEKYKFLKVKIDLV